MKNKLFILIVFLQFFIMSCETNHIYSYEIKDLLTQTQIILKSEDKNIDIYIMYVIKFITNKKENIIKYNL